MLTRDSGRGAGEVESGLAAGYRAQGSIWKCYQFVSTTLGAVVALLTLASADPDLSNPTRPRFERPLDTIRSFEAAIYGAYSTTRGSYARTGTCVVQDNMDNADLSHSEDAASQMGDYSRRTSYYGGMFQIKSPNPLSTNQS